MANVYGTDSAEHLNSSDGVTEGNDFIFGYGGDDHIWGNGGNDTLKGGGGADTLFGGYGVDTANYSDSSTSVVVSLQTGRGYYGTAEGDTLIGIENLTGSAYGDALTGNSAGNVLTGLEGSDALYGGGGADTLSGGKDSDWLVGGAGADTLDGGTGNDTAGYYDSTAAVTVTLISGVGSGGHAEGDTLTGIENVTGSIYDDTLWGDNAVNQIDGDWGDDTLKGFGGNDFLSGNDGNDALFGGVGSDTLIGGFGDDTLEGQDNADFLTGGAGNDTFVFRPGQVGDIVVDFEGNGAAAGDQLVFDGFGPGATLSQLDTWTWQVTYDGGASTELLAFENGASIDISDYMFV